MKIVSYINQHFPIWSMLNGDHVSKNKIDLINPKLIKSPDFLNPIENNLRYNVFKAQHNYIAEKMDDRVSFALIKFSCTELRDFYTCFQNITIKEYAKEYNRAFCEGDYFKIGEITKSYNDIDNQMWLTNKVKRDYFTVYYDDVLNTGCDNNILSYAINRSIIMKSDGKYFVLDGTDRLTAYCMAAKQNEQMPDELYGFCFERNCE